MINPLIIGGGGFIGRHLCDVLSRAGMPYTVTTRAGSADNFPGGDVVSDFALGSERSKEIAARHQVIILLASASVPATFQDSVEDEIQHNLLPYSSFLSSLAPNTKVIFLSSGGTVYGDAPSGRGSREDDPLQPRSPYGLVKFMIEETIRFQARRRGFSFVILRPSNPIGPHLRPPSVNDAKGQQGVVTVFLQNILLNRKVTLIGDGSARRDYFDVRDLARAIYLLIRDEQVNNVTLNVGSGISLSLTELLEHIESTVDFPFEIVRLPARSFDVGKSLLDIDRIMATIEWRPEIPIGESVRDTWKCLRS